MFRKYPINFTERNRGTKTVPLWYHLMIRKKSVLWALLLQGNTAIQVHPWKKCQFRLTQQTNPVQNGGMTILGRNFGLNYDIEYGPWIDILFMDELESRYSPVHGHYIISLFHDAMRPIKSGPFLEMVPKEYCFSSPFSLSVVNYNSPCCVKKSFIPHSQNKCTKTN